MTGAEWVPVIQLNSTNLSFENPYETLCFQSAPFGNPLPAQSSWAGTLPCFSKSYGFHQTIIKRWWNVKIQCTLQVHTGDTAGKDWSQTRLAVHIPTCSSNRFPQNHWESMEIFNRMLQFQMMIPEFSLNFTERVVVGLVTRNCHHPWYNSAED